MGQTDWIGIAAVIAAVAAAAVSVINAIQSLRNHTAIKEVEKQVNGVTAQRIAEAKVAAKNEARIDSLEESGILRRGKPTPPAV